MTKDEREIQRKLKVLYYAEKTGHVARACRYFGVGRSNFYRWKRAYEARGEAGLFNANPQLNGKVERSHRSDQQEFYQLLSYKDDVDLEAKLDEWEHFYNFNRPHGASMEKHTMKRSEKDFNEQLGSGPIKVFA